MPKTKAQTLTPDERKKLLAILKQRFDANMSRHKGMAWSAVAARLDAHPEKLWSLSEMERTGGEPDVIGDGKKKDEYIFYDCATETPKGRRSICYDRAALEARKEHVPADSAIDMATAMGVEMLSEEQYRVLQKFVMIDSKTSSWIKTPADIRKLGGALFADFRYGHVFIYHNGASSYYAVRGFRALLTV
jgi:hypothetical protein